MRHPIIRLALSLLAGWLMALSSPAQAALSQVARSITQSHIEGGYGAASLSPDGKHVALIGFAGSRTNLFLIDADSGKSQILSEGKWLRKNPGKLDRANSEFKPPISVIWAGNDLLVVNYQTHIESMTLDGRPIATLANSPSGTRIIAKAAPDQVASQADSQVNPQADSPMILVSGQGIWLANARTGTRTEFTLSNTDIPANYKLDSYAHDKHGQIRAVSVLHATPGQATLTRSNWYRPDVNAKWEKLASFAATDDYWLPDFVPDEANTLTVRSNMGRDTWAIFRYDTQKKVIAEMLAGHPTEDIRNVEGVERSAFTRVTTAGILPQQVWLDAKWAKIQAGIDQALPGHINILSGNSAKRVLILSYSDTDPGAYLIFDTESATLRQLTRVRPIINPEQMKLMQPIAYLSKDGLSIPAYLTRPDNQATPRPAVVYLHDGLTARDHWQWQAVVQLLASQGYVVLQPQFRGSSGFGKKFLKAGVGQWGLAIQDDITAGVEYLIKQGIADPKRICIYGTGYSGYSAMWGLVTTPELYRCGISFAGVSDLGLLYQGQVNPNQDEVDQQIKQIALSGGEQASAAKFDSLSPVKQAARIVAPVLLFHGDKDQVVPISHGKKMKQALEQNKKNVEWVLLDDEGHNLYYLDSLEEHYQAMLAFLAKHLGSTPPAAKPVASATAPDS
jgi:dipeptidyl aminopeptidase/acylaminoacyl peptidase